MSDPDYSHGYRDWREEVGLGKSLPLQPMPFDPGLPIDTAWLDYNDAWRENARRNEVAKLPRVRFLFFERDWYQEVGRSIGVMWDKDPNPNDGYLTYRRSFVIHIAFKVWLERR